MLLDSHPPLTSLCRISGGISARHHIPQWRAQGMWVVRRRNLKPLGKVTWVKSKSPVLYLGDKRSKISCTTGFNVQKFCVLAAHCVYVFLYRSQNKQRLFQSTALTDWFL